MKHIKLPKGFSIGHANNDHTGVTVILAADKTVGGVCVRGSAPGTRETDLLKADKAVQEINAIVLTGGSAFGLGACDGVVKFLSEQGIGFDVGKHKVPLVAGAVIFDLKDELVYPTADMGYKACKNASDKNFKWGSVGAGTGATVGKILGPTFSQKSGIGAITVEAGTGSLFEEQQVPSQNKQTSLKKVPIPIYCETTNVPFVTAITVCNAVGDVVDKTGQIVAGVGAEGEDKKRQFVGAGNMILAGASGASVGGNTTLTCLITNVKLDKLHANKLASIAHNGYAKSINPVHTDYDGDTVFALSGGDVKLDFTALSIMAVEAVCESIVNAVKIEN